MSPSQTPLTRTHARPHAPARACTHAHTHTHTQESTNQSIAAGAGEKMFFKALHSEVRKSTDFFISAEQVRVAVRVGVGVRVRAEVKNPRISSSQLSR